MPDLTSRAVTGFSGILAINCTCEGLSSAALDMAFKSGTCAVVVGLDLNGLGVVRSLGRAGIPTITLDTNLGSPTAATRFSRKIRASALSGPGLVDSLNQLRSTLAIDPVLILTQEASVETVSAMRTSLFERFRISMPKHETMLVLLDKLKFQDAAERLGFSIPRATRISGELSPAWSAHLRFPCVMKPTTKHLAWALHFKKAYKVHSADEVARLWAQMREVVDEVIVQEWIEGDDSDVYFCLQYIAPAGGTVSFVGRKLRQWPPLVGGTACCVPAPEAEELAALTSNFFCAVGFVGLGSMEYKRDRRDGRFYMVEPTVGRTDFQEEVATLNGINIPLAVYLGELGRPLPTPAPMAQAVGWRDPVGDANALATRSAPATIAQVPLRDAYFRLNDPGPYLALSTGRIVRRLNKLHPAADKNDLP